MSQRMEIILLSQFRSRTLLKTELRDVEASNSARKTLSPHNPRVSLSRQGTQRFVVAFSAGPPSPAEVRPGTAILVALGIQNLRTRVFRGVELKDHPLGIWNARIRCRVQETDFVVQEPKVYCTDVIFQLLGLSSSDDHTADGRPSQHPRERDTGWGRVMSTGHFLQRFYDSVAHLLVEGHERARFSEACAGRSRISAAVLACEKPAGKRAPDQDTDVVIFSERLELVFETPTDEAVIHLRSYVFLQP